MYNEHFRMLKAYGLKYRFNAIIFDLVFSP